MDLAITVGIVGACLTLASLGYAIYVTKRSKQVKELIYDLLPPTPIAGAVSKESGYSIKIVYEGPDKQAETVESVFAQYIRFTNFGRVPIKRDDSASNDPLRIEIPGNKVLDITVAKVAREVCQLKIGRKVEENGKVVAEINFDFLDYMDGGLIQIITESDKTHASLRGTIIGMPGGLVRGKKEKTSIGFPESGCVIPLVVQIAALISVPFIYHQLTGSWSRVWLLLLPVAALILPLAITTPIVFTILSRGSVKFPEHLKPPTWYDSRLYLYRDPDVVMRRAGAKSREDYNADTT